jgi:predicted phosphoribosyltransferase
MLAGVVDGQSNPAQGSASSPTTFVRNVDEIAVDFVVRNKKKPVLDLKPEDVVVTDDGSPQGTPAPR